MNAPLPATRRVSAVFSHIAAPNEGGVSFLDLLLKRFPYHNAEEWLARIHAGTVTLDGQLVTPETVITPRMRIEYRVETYDEPAVPLEFKELIANGDLALVHKPAGLPVHKTGKVFVNVLANLYRGFKHDATWTPLNRLDVETSGIVAFGRGKDVLRKYSPGTAESQWTKTYLAVVQGKMDLGGTDRGIHEGPLAEWPEHPIRSRMQVHPDGKTARTLYRPVEISRDKTLVLVRPVTGRKHQIRAHLSDLGFPVVGDKVYSLEGHYYLKRLDGELDAADIAALQAPHHLLHALSLDVRDAEGKGIAGMDSHLPPDFLRFFPDLNAEKLAEILKENPFDTQ